MPEVSRGDPFPSLDIGDWMRAGPPHENLGFLFRLIRSRRDTRRVDRNGPHGSVGRRHGGDIDSDRPRGSGLAVRAVRNSASRSSPRWVFERRWTPWRSSGAVLISVTIGLRSVCRTERSAQRRHPPGLDFMQTMPAFIYLLGGVLFPAGSRPRGDGIVVFAPPAVR